MSSDWNLEPAYQPSQFSQLCGEYVGAEGGGNAVSSCDHNGNLAKTSRGAAIVCRGGLAKLLQNFASKKNPSCFFALLFAENYMVVSSYSE